MFSCVVGEKPGADGLDLVVADLDRREDVVAAGVSLDMENESGVDVGEGDLGVGDDGAGGVLHEARDRALVGLRVCLCCSGYE